MSIRRREFILGSLAMPVLAGCGTFGPFGRRPALAFGVISDIHVTTPESTEKFRRALRYFRSRGADAVIVAGDLSDWGLKSGFRYVAAAWKEEMAGTEIVPLFCTGNHDYEGWWYGDMTLDMHVQGYSEDEALVKLGMDRVWQEVFGEPFSLMRHRKVKGYDFISAEWEEMDKTHSEPRTAQWFREHASELPKDRPFFFFRHEPIPDTVIGFAKKTEENLTLKAALKAFPNCIAFGGHTHWTLNDERSIWQGGFTSIAVPSMEYTTLPKGPENGRDVRNGKSVLGMPRIANRAEGTEAQGYFVSVYADGSTEVERYDFEAMEEAAPAWLIPSAASGRRPYVPEEHAKRTPVPAFAAGDALRIRSVNGDRRNGTWAIFYELRFPTAKAGGRVFDYEARVEREDGTSVGSKTFLSPAFHKLPSDEPSEQRFLYDAMDLPETGHYRFAVYPRNCFGAKGKPLFSRSFETKPGKDKVAADR